MQNHSYGILFVSLVLSGCTMHAAYAHTTDEAPRGVIEAEPSLEFSREELEFLQQARQDYGELNPLMQAIAVLAIGERNLDDIYRLLARGNNPRQFNSEGYNASTFIEDMLSQIDASDYQLNATGLAVRDRLKTALSILQGNRRRPLHGQEENPRKRARRVMHPSFY